jgi:hypothetical protein
MRETPRTTAWKIVAILEWAALLIALAMPITPSKTGSDFSLADWFFEDPSYLQEVLVYFILTNLLLGVLVLVALIIIWREKRRGGGSPREE